jgi:hypothetical protein
MMERKARVRMDMMVVYRSLDPQAEAKDWSLVHPDDVPAMLKDDPETMGRITTGETAQPPGDDFHYRAEITRH